MGFRSFIAINLPEEVRAQFERIINHLKKELPEINFLEAKNLHLTLRFLGNISETELINSRKVLKEITKNFKTFFLVFTGLVAFPNFNNPRILSFKARPSKKLIFLYTRIFAEFNRIKVGEGEKRIFKPHITIARIKERIRDLSFLKEKEIHIELPVKEISLMRSDLTPGGAQYKLIEKFPLWQK